MTLITYFHLFGLKFRATQQVFVDSFVSILVLGSGRYRTMMMLIADIYLFSIYYVSSAVLRTLLIFMHLIHTMTHEHYYYYSHLTDKETEVN